MDVPRIYKNKKCSQEKIDTVYGKPTFDESISGKRWQ